MMEVCSYGGRFDGSQHSTGSLGNTFKSCLRYSQISGYHAFYIIEEFGKRDTGDGRAIVQLYCPSCRNYQERSLVPAFEYSSL